MCTRFFYNNQRGLTQKLKKGEQPFLYSTCCLDLILIPIKLHEDISNGYRFMGCQGFLEKKII